MIAYQQQLLIDTVRRYINGVAWFYVNKGNNDISPKKISAAKILLAEIEGRLIKLGVNKKQLAKLKYYGEYLPETLMRDKISDAVLKYVMNVTNLASRIS